MSLGALPAGLSAGGDCVSSSLNLERRYTPKKKIKKHFAPVIITIQNTTFLNRTLHIRVSMPLYVPCFYLLLKKSSQTDIVCEILLIGCHKIRLT